MVQKRMSLGIQETDFRYYSEEKVHNHYVSIKENQFRLHLKNIRLANMPARSVSYQWRKHGEWHHDTEIIPYESLILDVDFVKERKITGVHITHPFPASRERYLSRLFKSRPFICLGVFNKYHMTKFDVDSNDPPTMIRKINLHGLSAYFKCYIHLNSMIFKSIYIYFQILQTQ